jgi:hypothetical protein
MRNKVIDRAAKSGDFSNVTAAKEAVFGGSGKKNSLNVICQGFVGVRHLQLHLKVRNSAQPAQKHVSLPQSGIGDGEAIKTVYF